jgi:hypothetical protein
MSMPANSRIMPVSVIQFISTRFLVLCILAFLARVVND